MLIGIDVGGTYTDGVAVNEEGEILAVAKYPTLRDNLLESLTGCLDQVMSGLSPLQVKRVSVSTTLLTNAVLQDKLEKTALLVIPGPGLDPTVLPFGVRPNVVAGAIDFRGRELAPVQPAQVKSLLMELIEAGHSGVAVAGKFAQRNNSHELKVESYALEHYPGLRVELSHRLCGSLNFPRRANTTYLTASSRTLFRHFLDQLEAGIRTRGITAPLYVLKADGGTLPLAAAARTPVETVYSGPAASVLGVLALLPEAETAVVMDIGGSTTDLGLILDGKPLLSSRGAEIGLFKTQVHSFAVTSANVGGDTPVEVVGGRINLGERRCGPAYCLGGSAPTPTDALRYLGLCEHGSLELAREGMESLASSLAVAPPEAARAVMEQVVERIATSFRQMVQCWEDEPAYRVWEVLHPHRMKRFKIFGVGGAAQGITPLVAEQLEAQWEAPEIGRVANALGAALAVPTFSCSLRADTGAGLYSIAETGVQLPWPNGRGGMEQARNLLSKHFRQRAWELGLTAAAGEITREEVFNVVRDSVTEGRIIEIGMELKAGVMTRVKGEERQ